MRSELLKELGLLNNKYVITKNLIKFYSIYSNSYKSKVIYLNNKRIIEIKKCINNAT